MTPRYRSVLVALLGRVAEPGGGTEAVFMASEVCQWPQGAAEALKAARLLRELPSSVSVTCLACEERCLRPVVSVINVGRSPQRVTWTCHLYNHLGPFDEPVEILRRMSSSREMVANYLGRALKLEVRKHDANWRRISFATLKINGSSRAFQIEFDGDTLVKVGSSSIHLIELLEWDEAISIDWAALTACFNASEDTKSGGKRVQPSTTVREDAKLATQLRNRRIQRRIEALAVQHPRLSKEQLAHKLVKSGEGEGMSASLIARVTRKPKKSGRKNIA